MFYYSKLPWVLWCIARQGYSQVADVPRGFPWSHWFLKLGCAEPTLAVSEKMAGTTAEFYGFRMLQMV